MHRPNVDCGRFDRRLRKGHRQGESPDRTRGDVLTICLVGRTCLVDRL